MSTSDRGRVSMSERGVAGRDGAAGSGASAADAAGGATVGADTAAVSGDEHNVGDFVEFVAVESAEASADETGGEHRLRDRLMRLTRQLVKFGLVGGLGVVIDLGLYNVLVLTVLGSDQVAGGPLIAKVISTLVAITTNWIGNRLWTFRQHRREDSAREGAEFFGVSLAGLVVGLLPLWISHFLLGFTSVFADNIANLIGIGLGSVFRFALYRFWVFAPSRRGAAAR